MHWYDVAGSLGAAMIVCAYLFLQLGRVESDSRGYLLANAIGAGLILISLSVAFNFSAFLIEAFWLAISLFGLLRRERARYGVVPAHGIERQSNFVFALSGLGPLGHWRHTPHGSHFGAGVFCECQNGDCGTQSSSYHAFCAAPPIGDIGTKGFGPMNRPRHRKKHQ